jgi:hypothetical protein
VASQAPHKNEVSIAVKEKQMKTIEILRSVKEKLSDPNHWSQGALRIKDDKGNITAWHLQAAVQDIADPENKELALSPNYYSYLATLDLLNFVCRNKLNGEWRAHGGGYWEFNDRKTTTHSDIIKLLDFAIELCSTADEKAPAEVK